MKYIIVLCDGMADLPIKSLNNKTLLQYAHTPNIDRLAQIGRTGQLQTIPDGFCAGSEVANISILGYNLSETYEGRASLEAAGLGIDLQEGDLVMRCNLVNVEAGVLNSHSSGNISTKEADILIKYLQDHLGSDKVKFYCGKQFRHLVVIKGGSKYLDCTPPHDIVFKHYYDSLPKAIRTEADDTVKQITDLILKSQELLAKHPLNVERENEKKMPANSIWLWSPGYRPKMEPFSTMYPKVQNGAVISATDLINGIGTYAGFKCIKVDGATGSYDTNYENKVKATIAALSTNDLVYLHIDACDEAGHEGDISMKQYSIEKIDELVIGPLYETQKEWETPVAMAVLPDHLTPCELRTHTTDAVPFMIYYPGIIPDGVDKFSEEDCARGGYGILKGNEFMNEFLGL